MTKLKHRFVDDDSLIQAVKNEYSTSLHQEFISKTAEARQQLKKILVIFLVHILSITICLLSLSQKWVTDIFEPFIFSIFILVLVSTFYVAYRLNKSHATFVRIATNQIVLIVTKILNREVVFGKELNKEQTKQILDQSNLFNESYDEIIVDDVYRIKGHQEIVVREVKIERRFNSNKKQAIINIFQGSLVTIRLNRYLSGETYISTTGDRKNFSHQGFWSVLLTSPSLEEINLEWNDFERDLHVAGTDQIEARTVLTTNFMLDLYHWWKIKEENIRLVFKGNELVLLLPDELVRIGTFTMSSDKNEVEKQILSVVKPLWRIITLAEDIKL